MEQARELCKHIFEPPSLVWSPRTVRLQIRRGQKKSDGSSVSVFMCPKKDMDPAKAVGSAVVKKLLEDFLN